MENRFNLNSISKQLATFCVLALLNESVSAEKKPSEIKRKACWDVRVSEEEGAFCYGAVDWPLSEDTYYKAKELDDGKLFLLPNLNFFACTDAA